MNNLHQVENPRAQVARVLADFYGELAGTVAKAPQFSFRRVFAEMTTKRGLCDGYEREITAGAALINGGLPHDPHCVQIPWGAFGLRAATPMVVATDAAGGFLKGLENLAAADVLRPWSVTARAGLTVLENLRETVTIPVVTVAPTGQWLSSEVTDIDAGTPTLGQATLAPHTFGALIAFSHRLLRQAPNVEQFLREQLLRAAGRALDQAVLAGSGSEQPVGILNTASLPSESGTAFAHANSCNMLETLSVAGVDDARVAFVAAPNARKLLQERVVVSSGKERFIWNDDRVLNRPAFATSDMTTALMLAGDFSRAILSLWGPGFEMAINPNDPVLFAKGVVQARVLVTCDVAVPQIGAFVKTTTIT